MQLKTHSIICKKCGKCSKQNPVSGKSGIKTNTQNKQLVPENKNGTVNE